MGQVFANRDPCLIGCERIRKARAATAVVVHVDQPGEQGRRKLPGVRQVTPADPCSLDGGADPGDRVSLDDHDAVLDHGARSHDATAQVGGRLVLRHVSCSFTWCSLASRSKSMVSKVDTMVWLHR